MIACFGSKKDEELWLMRNGRMLLEELISLFDGKINPIRQFSAAELKNAAKNLDQKHVLYKGSFRTLYRDFLLGRTVIVKKYSHECFDKQIIREIVIASRLSVHKNVLKLIGCCLEMELPTLIFESIDSDGTLDDHLHCYNRDELRPIPWKDRLKIAADVSNLVAYLHTALPRPLIYRDLKPSTMLLDKDGGIVKVFDFSLCVPLPEGESYIEDRVMGTWGFVDPEYVQVSRFNEKADVYSFGVILLVLVSGQMAFDPRGTTTNCDANLVTRARKCVENELFDHILHPMLSEEESCAGNNMQFKALLMASLKCTRDRAEDRPDITDVARQLREMYSWLVSSS